MTFRLKKIIPFLYFFALNCSAQTTWFADGYHGGVFGHYPKWQTQFVMDKMVENPEWRVNLEIEPETYDSVKVWDKADFLAFRDFVAVNDHKTLEFTNPTFSQPYCYNISGESLIRQFSYGMDKLRQLFPNLNFTTYSVEEPCFTSALPQLLHSFGFKNAVLKNPDTCWGGYTAAFGGELVNWQGPDGTAIVTVPRYACEKLTEKTTWQTIAWDNSKEYIDACFGAGIKHPVGMCYQDAGWKNGPCIGNPLKIASKYTLWSDYFNNIASLKSATDWKFSQEDVLVSLMWGAQVLQKLAQEVRVTENILAQTEKMVSMSKVNGGGVWNQKAFDAAWRGLMLSQHHDCWIVPYNKLGSNRKTWAENVSIWTGESDALCDGILKDITDHGCFSKNVSRPVHSDSLITVVNTLGYERHDIASYSLPDRYRSENFTLYDEFGNSIPYQIINGLDSTRTLLFQAKVPAMGSTCYRMDLRKAEKTKSIVVERLKNNSLKIETDIYQIVVDARKGGVITSLWDKQLKKQWVDKNSIYGLNELRGYLTDENRMWSSLTTPVTMSIVEQGPMLCKVQISGKIGVNPFTQTISITQGERRIDFKQEIDWKTNLHIGEPAPGKEEDLTRKNYYDDRFKLHLVFPATLQKPEVYKNAPFDVCKSKLKDTFFNRWDSIKHNVILNWVDSHDATNNASMALFTDHTTSYLQGENYPLGLTVQYSGGGLWGKNYNLKEKTEINYALYPHSGTWDEAGITYENARFNEPLKAFQGVETKAFKSILEIKDKSLVISGLYFEGEKLYLRIYNEGASGVKNLTLNFIPQKIEETNLEKQVVTPSFKTSGSAGQTSIEMMMPSFAIRTLCIQIN